MSTYAMLVRDAILSRLQAMSYFQSPTPFNFSTNRALQIQPQNVPFASVYFLNEFNTPDGDSNVGEVRFRQSAQYGISVIVRNNDAAAAENELDKAMRAINKLFNDPTLYNWGGDYSVDDGKDDPSVAKIQGYTRGSRVHVFGSVGMDNAQPIAELRYELTCDLGTVYYMPPTVDLRQIHIETRYPPGQADGVQQVTRVYDILQGELIAAKMKVSINVIANANVV